MSQREYYGLKPYLHFRFRLLETWVYGEMAAEWTIIRSDNNTAKILITIRDNTMNSVLKVECRLISEGNTPDYDCRECLDLE